MSAAQSQYLASVSDPRKPALAVLNRAGVDDELADKGIGAQVDDAGRSRSAAIEKAVTEPERGHRRLDHEQARRRDARMQEAHAADVEVLHVDHVPQVEDARVVEAVQPAHVAAKVDLVGVEPVVGLHQDVCATRVDRVLDSLVTVWREPQNRAFSWIRRTCGSRWDTARWRPRCSRNPRSTCRGWGTHLNRFTHPVQSRSPIPSQ